MINWKYLRRVYLFVFGFSILRSLFSTVYSWFQQCFDILLILKAVCYDNGLVKSSRTGLLVKIKMKVHLIICKIKVL